MVFDPSETFRERAVQKSPDAFRTISEVASELDVPQHVLRFWESKFSHIKPLKRAGGRRYYRPDDVELLRGIRHLLYSDGYTIKGVQKVLREQGVRFVVEAGREDFEPIIRAARPRPVSARWDGASQLTDIPPDAEIVEVRPPDEAHPMSDNQRARVKYILDNLLALKGEFAARRNALKGQ